MKLDFLLIFFWYADTEDQCGGDGAESVLSSWTGMENSAKNYVVLRSSLELPKNFLSDAGGDSFIPVFRIRIHAIS